MKYRYRNRKTGEEITTSNRVIGKNWEPIVEEAPVVPPIVEEAPVAEEPAEKAPAKAQKKGKK